jgi:aryl-alcohol dehydrogenase-like predicted oxidoreductase
MQKRKLGNTGLEVTVLGYGAMELLKLDEQGAVQLLNGVLDQGINFIDTAPCYGVSEEYIGKALASRRDEFILATKCGCARTEMGSAHVYDAPTFEKNVENSLRVLKTDHIDLLQIHAPMPEDIPGGEGDEMIVALQRMKREGKIGHVCVTFKNSSPDQPRYPDIFSLECLRHFKSWDVFEVFQIVYGGLTRKCEHGVDALAAAGKGVIARGSMNNFFPNYGELFEQAGLRALLEEGESPKDFLLRYTITHPGVSTAIVGTRSSEHLSANVKAASRGPLAAGVYAEAKKRMDVIGQKAIAL